MSNVLAGIGRGQLQALDERVRRKREIFESYRRALGDLPGVAFMPEAPWGCSNRWLTVITIAPDALGAIREDVRRALEAENIESRPLWKPMHWPLWPPKSGGESHHRPCCYSTKIWGLDGAVPPELRSGMA